MNAEYRNRDIQVFIQIVNPGEPATHVNKHKTNINVTGLQCFDKLSTQTQQNWLSGVEVDSLVTENVEVYGRVSHAVSSHHSDAAVEASAGRLVLVEQIPTQQDEIYLQAS